jgi:hypothetical protein
MGFNELPIQFTAAIVPEPCTLALVATALVGLAAAGRKRRAYNTDLKAGRLKACSR